ncbi:hypothetical protein [Marinobacter sp. MDS2]|uniref:hypothetical protein n=1 Tax=Marinobacter sp. MDS2 TaxID=3065961 RepID=UPI00273BE4D0|nr:hypothetical protein [Marinobacter sp. MDS2]MDP4546509.1 hypothetical protein [Marinobacter sp. MDS2]
MTKTDTTLFRVMLVILGIALACLAVGCFLGDDTPGMLLSAILSGNCLFVAGRLS